MNDLPPPLPPQPLEYRGDPAASFGGAPRRSPSIFSVARFVAAIAVMAIIAAILIFIIPRFETIFADFGVKLPAITQILLDSSRFLRTPLGWAVGIFVAGVIAIVFAVLPVRGRWLRLLVVMILAIFVLGLALAVFMPMIDLMNNVAGPSGKK